ncbi:MAG: helix-turn-helix transcriptional regulator [Clostridia bacterium]|nr:helix-turn-helix transcriptional regulator [Clostridia bacterium]
MESYTPTNYAYSAMGYGRSDYDAFYGLSEEMNYFGWHCHDFYELYIHLQGAEFYSVDNQTYRLKPNQLIIIPPFLMHGLMANNTLRHYERAFIYLSPEFMKNLGCGQIDIEQMLTERMRSNRFVFNMEEKAARECAAHIGAVHRNIQNHQPWDRFTDITHLLPALRLMLEAANASSEPLPVVQSNPLMHEILSYIETHCAESLNLRSLAERFSISQSSLSHQFLAYTHHSVYEYILYKRVMMAKQRLIENVPPGEVAFQCGFGDYSNFLRAFQKISGISPRKYQSDMRAKTQEG